MNPKSGNPAPFCFRADNAWALTASSCWAEARDTVNGDPTVNASTAATEDAATHFAMPGRQTETRMESRRIVLFICALFSDMAGISSGQRWRLRTRAGLPALWRERRSE